MQTSTIQVHVLPGGRPRQVDDFGPTVERSCVGALHLRPGSLAVMTRDEFEHIRSNHPTLRLVEMATTKAAPVRPAETRVEEAVTEPAPETVEPPESLPPIPLGDGPTELPPAEDEPVEDESDRKKKRRKRRRE